MRFTPGFRRHALVAALSAIYGAAPQLVQANPTGAQVVNGQAVLQTLGNKLTVTNTPGAIINWQSFSIGAGETTYFQQQSAGSAVLNRVQAQNPSLQSRIDGTLGSNGRVFLINPNGVVFGAGSVIDTQGFVASTLSMRDDDFKAGKLKFARQGAAADLLAQGRISSGNGDVYLVAPNISVDGKAVISTQGGNVVLAAGEMVEITGRNLNDITFAVQNPGNQVLNLGTLSGGAVGVFAGTLTHSGLIQAQALARDGGKLVLKALGNVTLGSGSTSSANGPDLGGQVYIESRFGNVVVDARAVVSAQALAAAQPLVIPRGGSVTISAPDGLVAIEHEAVVNASGAHGGAVYVDSARFLQDGAIRADGQYSVGGTITVQADSRIVQSRNASMTATGVLRGGAIHLSVDADPAGAGHLFSSARIDASASTGDGGQVTVTGRELAFVGARVLANGDAGGGQVRLGGGRAGKDSSIANAQNIVASGSSSFEASARQDGDGGSVIAWADGNNRFASVVEARGGVGGGNGGFIEVSAKQETQFGGVANASAPLGKAGTFLLDPKFILIQAPVITAGTTVELIDPNPGTGDLFGSSLQRFNINAPNETILIANGLDDLGGTNAGAVYLFDGTTGALISHLRGSSAGDQVGSLLQSLGGNNRALRSPSWDNAGVVNAGAITWFDGAVGLSGTVSASNSLVGSHANDAVGTNNLVQLNFGTRYYTHTPQWGASKGALTFIDTSAPVTGVVSSGNSLVGSLANDRLGSGGIFNISSAKTLVFSPEWNGNRGAVTWFDNTAGTMGDVSSANSLVGSTAGDRVGSGFYDFFGTGKVAIFSPDWSNGLLAQAGAITWGSTSVATTGVVGVANSLFGANASDRVGDNGIDNLAFVGGSQKYYVQTPDWGLGAGAVTFVDSVAPPMGAVTAANSLVGEDPSSQIGSGQIRVLNNGNFVVISPDATVAGVARAGAITWASGLGGPTTQGVVGAANSLVGTSVNDHVGSGTFVDLFTGNYVVASPNWGGGRGAATFGSGTTQIIGNPDLVGTVGGHSLFGNSNTSAIGSAGVRELNSSGNFAVFSPGHGLAPADNFGAVSIGDATTGFLGASTAPITNSNSIVGIQVGDAVGINPGSNFFDRGFAGYYLLRTPSLRGTSGVINAAGVTFLSGVPVAGDVNTLSGASGNSIVGSRANDNVGSSITFLNNNNNFVVASPTWDNGAVGNAGAVTFGDQTSGFTSGSRTPGVITAANSLVGSGAGDQIGSGGIVALPGGNYLVRSPLFAVSTTSGGAVSWGDGSNAITGTIAATTGGGNSIFGAPNDQIGSGGIEFLGCNFCGFNSGNFVVRSPEFNGQRGAMTFGNALTGFANSGMVSGSNSLVGTQSGEKIGSGGIQRLDDPFGGPSSYLIKSPLFGFNNGVSNGAITWASATLPILGTVGSETNGNSIFGAPGDQFGSGGIDLLNNNHFVVRSPDAARGAATTAGAVTFGRYDTGFAVPGAVSTSNSLMGTNTADRIGSGGIVELFDSSNFTLSNYLIRSPDFGGGGGAVTWANGTLAISGQIGAETNGNSIFGASGESVGNGGIQVNANSGSYNFVVVSTIAAGGFGAASFGRQTTGFALPGLVGSSNSIVGNASGDNIGSAGVQFLNDDVFTVRSPGWNGGRGAISWGSDLTGLPVGVVGSANSLLGGAVGDQVGASSLTSFGAGYLARTAGWNGNRGALTYVDLASPVTGAITSSNSLVGSTPGDQVASSAAQNIGNNKVAVFSPAWDNGGAVDAGAVTWLDALAPLSGFVGLVGNPGNSLVGSSAGDGIGSSGIQSVGSGGLLALRNANWDNAGVVNAGAITWVNSAGTLPTGAVSAGNSLVGSNTNDLVGNSTSFVQGSGYLVVRNAAWNGNRSAVTWMPSAAPLTGVISSANSLVGANPNDQIGSGGIFTSFNNGSFSLANGDYVVSSPAFASFSGALTIGSAATGISGTVSGANSQVGLGTSFQFINNRSRLMVTATNATNQGLTNAGRVCLYAGGAGCPSSLALGPQGYGDNASGSVTITPSQITAITNNGTNVVLQANSDIVLDGLSDIVSNNPTGNGGSLTLQAGRSVFINSNIVTDNGNLTVIANDRVSNGVSAANRDPGTAEITMANGMLIDAGTGSVSMQLRDGAGHSGSGTADGVITVRSITANNLSLVTDLGGIQVGDPNATAPSLIKLSGNADLIAKTKILFTGGVQGAQAELSADGQITIDPPILEMRTGGSFARIVNPTNVFPIKLEVSECIACVFVSPYEITGVNSELLTIVTASLLSLNPNLLDQIEDTKESKGEIEVDAGETCK